MLILDSWIKTHVDSLNYIQQQQLEEEWLKNQKQEEE